VKSPKQHIILIGFKHVGKSVIGRALARQVHKSYIDLDHEIERLYKTQYQATLTCRAIVKTKGENFFRELEQAALQQVTQSAPCVISTGGGTPMQAENCQLMAPHCIIYITAKPKQVFDRIMKKGRPAFFPADEDPWVAFKRLWQEREKVYKELATFSVENNDSVALTVDRIMEALKE